MRGRQRPLHAQPPDTLSFPSTARGAQEPCPSLDEQIQNRRDKRQRLAEAGINPYPHRFDWDLEPTGVRQQHGEKTAEELEAAAIRLRVPGRVKSVRRQGKLIFSDIHDGKEKLQLFIRLADVPEAAGTVLENLDLGDIVGAAGTLMRTRAGELSLKVDDLTLLSKAVRPLPEKWHGIADVEIRYRQRYLDLATNEDSRKVFEVRAAVVKGIREFLDARGFLEVETPMMQVIPGGATARPFKTHHNALDIDLYLRIAPEPLPQAAAGRRHPPGLRDQPQLPQRGDLHPPQPRVHDAGVLLGLCRLPADDGPHRGADLGARRAGAEPSG